MGGGEIDEVEINGVTWTRFVATHGATLPVMPKHPNGTTVSIYANSNLTWEDAPAHVRNGDFEVTRRRNYSNTNATRIALSLNNSKGRFRKFGIGLFDKRAGFGAASNDKTTG